MYLPYHPFRIKLAQLPDFNKFIQPSLKAAFFIGFQLTIPIMSIAAIIKNLQIKELSVLF